MALGSTSILWFGDTQPGQNLVIGSSQLAQGAYPSGPRLRIPETEFQRPELEEETMPSLWLAGCLCVSYRQDYLFPSSYKPDTVLNLLLGTLYLSL